MRNPAEILEQLRRFSAKAENYCINAAISAEVEISKLAGLYDETENNADLS